MKKPLSFDAITFRLAYLPHAKATLSFGGEGAEMAITKRGRSALDELLEAGYAAPSDPTDSIPGREFHKGQTNDPPLWTIAEEADIDQGRAMEADGIPVCWVYSSVPFWAAIPVFGRVFLALDRVFRFPSRIGKGKKK